MASISKKFSFNFPKALHTRKQGDDTQVMKWPISRKGLTKSRPHDRTCGRTRSMRPPSANYLSIIAYICDVLIFVTAYTVATVKTAQTDGTSSVYTRQI